MSQSIQNLSGKTGRELCDDLPISYGTLQRWRRRAAKGQPLLARPGPKKLGPLALEELRREIEALAHRRKRSAGSGALIRRYQESISRRDLMALISEERTAVNARQRQHCQHITWNQPNLAWAIDATEYGRDRSGRKLFVVAIVDLASRHHFEPLVTFNPRAGDVTSHLRKIFRSHGPPLLLKRDNGSPFKNASLDALLAGACVIPLNSPAHYPRYNGGIEKAIREFKQTFEACLPQTPMAWDLKAVSRIAISAAHLRNCGTRRILGGQSAAQVYHQQPRARFDKRERHIIFEWIKTRSDVIMQQMDKADHRSIDAAWRHAVETWLRCQNLISLTTNQ